MATHLLAVLNVPTSKKLNSILSTFFWGDINGKAKKKWYSWSKLCKPTLEGDLGLREFANVQRSFHMKFAWRILVVDNLWTLFFKTKYVRHGHLLLAKNTTACSRFWKSVMIVLPNVCNNICWRITEGRASFWYDLWLAKGPLCLQVQEVSSLLQIKECWAGANWDLNVLEDFVGTYIMGGILCSLSAGKEAEDVIIWKPTSDGEISSTSAWDVEQQKFQVWRGSGISIVEQNFLMHVEGLVSLPVDGFKSAKLWGAVGIKLRLLYC